MISCVKYLLILLFLFLSTKLFSQTTGKVVIHSNIEYLLLIIDEDVANYQEYAAGDTLVLDAGNRIIRLVAQNVSDNVFEIDVYPDQITETNVQFFVRGRNPNSSYSSLMKGSNFTVVTDEDSDIYLNESFLGTGFAKSLLSDGEYDLRIVNENHGELNYTFDSRLNYPSLIERYNEDHSFRYDFNKLLPGGAYLKNKKYTRAYSTYVVLGSLIVARTVFIFQRNKAEDDLEVIRDNIIIDQTQVEFYENERDTYQRRANRMLLAAGATYLWTTINGLKKPKDGYRTRPKNVTVDVLENGYPSLTLRKNLN